MRELKLSPGALKALQAEDQAIINNESGILTNEDISGTGLRSGKAKINLEEEIGISDAENAWNRIKRGMDQTQMNAYEKLELDSTEGKGMGHFIESVLGDEFLDSKIIEQKIDIFNAEKRIKEKDANNTPPRWWKSVSDHVFYDFADVVGSSMSMMGMTLGGAAAGFVLGGNPMSAFAIGALGTSLGRYQESLSESGENYKRTKAELENRRGMGDPKYAGLTDADIHSRSLKASDDVFSNNMKLLALDVPMMLLSFAPLGRMVGKATAGVIGKSTGYASKNMLVQGLEKSAYLSAAKPSLKYLKGAASYAAVMAGEGTEEGLQFAMGNSASAKALDEESMSFSDMLYNKEFQDSVKSGIELGGFMKGVGHVGGFVAEKTKKKMLALQGKAPEKGIEEWNDMQDAQRVDLLFKNMYQGTLPSYFGELKGLADSGALNTKNRKDKTESEEVSKAVDQHKARAIELIDKFNAALVQYPKLAEQKNSPYAQQLFKMLDQDAKIDATLEEAGVVKNPDVTKFYTGVKKQLGKMMQDVASLKFDEKELFALADQEQAFKDNGFKLPEEGAKAEATKIAEVIPATTTTTTATKATGNGSANVSLGGLKTTESEPGVVKAAKLSEEAQEETKKEAEPAKEEKPAGKKEDTSDEFRHIKSTEDQLLEELDGSKQNIEVSEDKAEPLKGEAGQQTKFKGSFTKGTNKVTGEVATITIEDGMIKQPLSKNVVKIDKKTKEKEEIDRAQKEVPAYDYVDKDGNKFVVGFQPVPKWKGDKSKKKFNAVASGYLIPIKKDGSINSEDVVMFYASPEAKKEKNFLRYDDWPAMRDRLGLKPVGKAAEAKAQTKAEPAKTEKGSAPLSPESGPVSSESGTKPAVHVVNDNKDGTFDVVDKETGEVVSKTKYKTKAAAVKLANKLNKDGKTEQKKKETKKKEKKPTNQSEIKFQEEVKEEVQEEVKETTTQSQVSSTPSREAWDGMSFSEKHENLHNRITFDGETIEGTLSLSGMYPAINMADGTQINLVSEDRIPVDIDKHDTKVTVDVVKPEVGLPNVIESITGQLYFRYVDSEGVRTYPYELHVMGSDGKMITKVFRNELDNVVEKPKPAAEVVTAPVAPPTQKPKPNSGAKPQQTKAEKQVVKIIQETVTTEEKKQIAKEENIPVAQVESKILQTIKDVIGGVAIKIGKTLKRIINSILKKVLLVSALIGLNTSTLNEAQVYIPKQDKTEVLKTFEKDQSYKELSMDGKVAYDSEVLLKKPFVIVDKPTATVYIYSAEGKLTKSFPAILGAAKGDQDVADYTETDRSKEGVTPAGRFELDNSKINEQDKELYKGKIYSLKGSNAIALHITYPSELAARTASLNTPTLSDNRMSWGCINVSEENFDAYFKDIGDGNIVIVTREDQSQQTEGPAVLAPKGTASYQEWSKKAIASLDASIAQDKKDLLEKGRFNDITTVLAREIIIAGKVIAREILKSINGLINFSEKLVIRLNKDSRFTVNDRNPEFPIVVAQILKEVQEALIASGSNVIIEKPELIKWFEKNNDNTADFLQNWGDKYLADRQAEVVKDEGAETFSVRLTKGKNEVISFRKSGEAYIQAKGLTESKAKEALVIYNAANLKIIKVGKSNFDASRVVSDVMAQSHISIEDLEAEGIRLSDEIAQKKFAYENNLKSLQNAIAPFFKVPGLTEAQVVDALIEMVDRLPKTEATDLTPMDIMNLYVGEGSTLPEDIKEQYKSSGLTANAFVSLHMFATSFGKEENMFLSFGGNKGVQLLASNRQSTATSLAQGMVSTVKAFTNSNAINNQKREAGWKELGQAIERMWQQNIKPLMKRKLDLNTAKAQDILARIDADKKLKGAFWFDKNSSENLTLQSVLEHYHKDLHNVTQASADVNNPDLDYFSRRYKFSKEIYDLSLDQINLAREQASNMINREIAYLSSMTGLSSVMLRAAAENNDYSKANYLANNDTSITKESGASALVDLSLLTMSDRNPATSFLTHFIQSSEFKETVFPNALQSAFTDNKKQGAINSFQQRTQKGLFNLPTKIAKAYVNSDATLLMSSYRGVSGKRKDGAMLNHLLRRINLMVPELAANDKFKDNAFVQMHKDNPPRMVWIEGVKNVGFPEGTDVDKLNPDDIRLMALSLFYNGGQKGTSFHLVELLGDRGKFPAVETVKRTLQQAKALVGDIDLTGTINNLTKVILNAQENGSFPTDLDISPKEFATLFAYNYAANKMEVDAVYQGNDKQYGSYRKLTKRASQLASTGLRLVQGLKGGVPKSVKAVIIKDAGGVAYVNGKPFRIKEVSNGTTYISEKLNDQINVSSGSIYNIKDTIKGLYKRTDPISGNHMMIKSNLVVLTKKHALANGGVDGTLYQLWQAMNDGNIDVIAFDSSAKVTGDTKINELNYRTKTVSERDPKTGKKKDVVYATSNLHKGAIAKQGLETFDFEFDNFIIQQDLRATVDAEDMRFENKEFPVQVYRFLMQFPEFDAIQKKFNDQQQENYNTIGQSVFNSIEDSQKFLEFLKERLRDNETDNYISNLITNASKDEKGVVTQKAIKEMLTHPFVQEKMASLLGNYFAKNVVQRTASRFAMQEVGSYGINKIEGDARLKSTYIDKDTGKVVPGEALIPASLEKDTFIIDGQKYLIIIRVPTTQMHSISLVKVVGTVPNEMSNVIITDIATQFKSGSDNDGDQRFCISMFKPKKDKALTKQQQLSNDAVMSIFNILQKPEYFEINNAEINVEAFDSFIPKEDAVLLDKRDFDSFTTMWENNSDSKSGIAVAARTQAVLMYLEKIGAKIINGPIINGRKIKDFTAIPEDSMQSAIELANLTNLIVDNTKEGKMTKLGLADSTISMYFLLRKAGLSVEQVTHLLTKNEVGVQMIKGFQESQSHFSDITKGMVMKELRERYGYKRSADQIKFDFEKAENIDVVALLDWANQISSEMFNYGEISRIAEDGITNNNDYLQARKLEKYMNDGDVLMTAPKSRRLIRFDKMTDVTKAPVFASFQMALSLMNQSFKSTIFSTYLASKLFNTLDTSSTKTKQASKVMASLVQAALVNHFKITADMISKDKARAFYADLIQGTDLEQYLSIDNGQIVMNSTYRFGDVNEEIFPSVHDAMNQIENKPGNAGFIDRLAAYQIGMYGWSVSATNGGFAQMFDNDIQLEVAKALNEVRGLWNDVSDESSLELISKIAMRYPEEFAGYVYPAELEDSQFTLEKARTLPMVIQDKTADKLSYKIITKDGKMYRYQKLIRTAPDAGMTSVQMVAGGRGGSSSTARYKTKEELASESKIGNVPLTESQLKKAEKKEVYIALGLEDTWFTTNGSYGSNGKIFSVTINDDLGPKGTKKSANMKLELAQKLGFDTFEDAAKDPSLSKILDAETGTGGRVVKVSLIGNDMSKAYISPTDQPVIDQQKPKQNVELTNILKPRMEKISSSFFEIEGDTYVQIKDVQGVDQTTIGVNKDIPIAILKHKDGSLIALEPMTGAVLAKDYKGTVEQLKGEIATQWNNVQRLSDKLAERFEDISAGRIQVSPRYRMKTPSENTFTSAQLSSSVKPTDQIKYMDDRSDEPSYGDDVAFQEQIRKELAKIFPEVIVFSDPNEFQVYIDKHHPGNTYDLSKLGGAIGRAILIDPKRAVQSGQVHEHAHIYWDSLPNTNAAKKRLKAFYTKDGVFNEEALIIDLGKSGTEHLRQRFSGKPITKLLLALKDFWTSIKAIFGKATKQELIDQFGRTMLRVNSTSSLGARVSNRIKYMSAKLNDVANDVYESVEYLSGQVDNGVVNNPGTLTTILDNDEAVDRFRLLLGNNMETFDVEDHNIPEGNTLLLKKKVTYSVRKAMFMPGQHNQIVFGVTKAMSFADAVKFDFNPGTLGDANVVGTVAWKNDHVGTPMHAFKDAVIKGATFEQALKEAIRMGLTDIDQDMLRTKIYDPQVKEMKDVEAGGGIILGEVTVGHSNYGIGGKVDKMIIYGDGTIKIVDYKTSTERIYESDGTTLKPSYTEGTKQGGASSQEKHFGQLGMYSTVLATEDNTSAGTRPAIEVKQMEVQPIYYKLDKAGKIIDIEMEAALTKEVKPSDTIEALKIIQEFNNQYIQIVDLKSATISMLDIQSVGKVYGFSYGQLKEDLRTNTKRQAEIYSDIHDARKIKDVKKEELLQKELKKLKKEHSEHENKIKKVNTLYEQYRKDIVDVKNILSGVKSIESLSRDKLWSLHADLSILGLAAKNEHIDRVLLQMKQKMIAEDVNMQGQESDITQTQKWMMAPSHMTTTQPFIRELVKTQLVQTQVAENRVKKIHKELEVLDAAVRKEWDAKNQSLSVKFNRFITKSASYKYYQNMWKVDIAGNYENEYKDPSDPSLTAAEKAYIEYIIAYKNQDGTKGDTNVKSRLHGSKSGIANKLGALLMPPSTFEIYHTLGFFPALFKFIGDQRRIEQVRLYADMPVEDAASGKVTWVKGMYTYGELKSALETPGIIKEIGRVKQVYYMNKYIKKAGSLFEKGFHDADVTVGQTKGDKIDSVAYKEGYFIRDGKVVVDGANNMSRTVDAEYELHSSWYYGRSKREPFSLDVHSAMQKFVMDTEFEAAMSDKVVEIGGVDGNHVSVMQMAMIAQISAQQGKEEQKHITKWLKMWVNRELLGAGVEPLVFGATEVAVSKIAVAWTYFAVMTFSVPLGIFNLAIGIMNNLTHGNARRYLKFNAQRLFEGGTPFFSKTNKATAMMKQYEIVNYRPEIADGSMTGRFVQFSTILISLGEQIIQKTGFLANIDQDIWDNATVGSNGEIVWKDPNGPMLDAEKIASLKIKSSNIQGKYDPHDSRNYKGVAAFQLVGQFKTWLPDMLRMLFGGPSVDVFGNKHVGMMHGAALWLKWLADVPTKGFAEANANYQQFKSMEEYLRAERAALKSIVMMTAMYLLWAMYHGDDEDKEKAETLQKLMTQYLGMLSPRELLGMATVPAVNTADKVIQAFEAVTNRVMNGAEESAYKKSSVWGKKNESPIMDKFVQASPYKNLIGWAGGFKNPDYGNKKGRSSSQSEFDNFDTMDDFSESFE